MRRTRHGIELKRGNIRITFDEGTVREGIQKLREEDAAKESYAKADRDPSGWVQCPSNHSVHHRFAEPWRGSGASARSNVVTGHVPVRNEHGLTVQAGLTTADALRMMQNPSV
jgi:hypothetical protein